MDKPKLICETSTDEYQFTPERVYNIYGEPTPGSYKVLDNGLDYTIIKLKGDHGTFRLL